MFKGIFRIIISYLLVLFSLLLSISLISFTPNDFSFYTSAPNFPPLNSMGIFGVKIAASFITFYGKAAWIWVFFSLLLGIRLLTGITPKDLLTRFLSIHYLATILSIIIPLITDSTSFLDGGFFGILVKEFLTNLLPNFIWIIVFIVLFILGLNVWNFPRKIIQKMQLYFLHKKKIPIYEGINQNDNECRVKGNNEQFTENIEEDNIQIENIFLKDENSHYGGINPLIENQNDKESFDIKTPAFLQMDVEPMLEDTEPLYFTKKRLSSTENPNFLRDTDIDLLSPYRREVSPFYQKIKENTQVDKNNLYLELDDSTGVESEKIEELSDIWESLEELDQSSVFIPPINELEKDISFSIEQFAKNRHPITKLSFENGFIKRSEDEVKELEYINNKENSQRKKYEAILELENQFGPIEIVVDEKIEEKINKNIEKSDKNIEKLGKNIQEVNKDIEIIEEIQHSSKFPPIEDYTSKHLILEKFTDQLSYKDQILTEQEELAHNNHLSDTEELLLQGIDGTNETERIKQKDLKEKIHEKQKELADQYHQQYYLNEEELDLITRLEEDNGIDEQFEFSKQLHKKQKKLAQQYYETHRNIDYNLNDILQDINPNNEKSYQDNLFIIQDLENEILELKNSIVENNNNYNQIIPEQESIIQKIIPHEEEIDSDELLKELMILPINDDSLLEKKYLESSFNDDDSIITDELLDPITIDHIPNRTVEDITHEAYKPNNYKPLTKVNLDISTISSKEIKLGSDDNIMELNNKEKNELNMDINIEKVLNDSDGITNFPLIELQDVTDIVDYYHGDIEKEIISDQKNEHIDTLDIIDILESKNQQDENDIFLNSLNQSIGNNEKNISSEYHLEDDIPENKSMNNILIFDDIISNPNDKTIEKLYNDSSVFLDNNGVIQENEVLFDEYEDNLHEINPIKQENPKMEANKEQDFKNDEELPIIKESFIQEIPEELDYQPIFNFSNDTDIEQEQEFNIIIPGIGEIELEEEDNEIIDDQFLMDIDEIDLKIDKDIIGLQEEDAALLPMIITKSHLVNTENYLDEEIEKTNQDIILPIIEDLEPNTIHIDHEAEEQEIENTMKMIEDTYESFNINMQVVDYSRGPTITRFELEPPSGLKLRTIFNLQDDLALQAGTSSIRIISPVEGRSLIGIEVPNKIRKSFLLREQIESVLFQETNAALPLILGVDVGGKEMMGDLTTTPHLLIAGTTGSGKSVYVNALIMGLLYKLSAEELRFIMIDPKMVELELYNGIPHLLAPIITKPEEAMAALEWAVQEMDRRYKILSELSVRNIKEYQELAKKSNEKLYEKLPYIVIIVDEFANLMLRAPKDTERHISRLASMARAVGMHIVLATQRPSVDVVTGVIKANFPSRIAFRVTSKIDSRTILDKNGAETLLGRGDMLYMSPNYMDAIRMQSPYVSGEDVARVVNRIKKNSKPNYVINFTEMLIDKEENQENSKTNASNDPLFEEVIHYAVDNGEVSASGIQRRFRVGYNRASRLIETMKDLKIISPPPSAGKGWSVNIIKSQIEDYLN